MSVLNYLKEHLGTILIVSQSIVAVILIILVLIQAKGSGVSELFGGGMSNVYRTKRGFEKILHIITIIVAVLFVSLAFASFLIIK